MTFPDARLGDSRPAGFDQASRAAQRHARQNRDLAFAHLKAAIDDASGAFLLKQLSADDHACLCREALAAYVKAVSAPLVVHGDA